jgi:hypothetical protein
VQSSDRADEPILLRFVIPMSDLTKYLEKEWGSLIGATLIKVRNATAEEAEELGWEVSAHEPIPFLEFDTGEGLCLSQDPEGNGPGFAFLFTKEWK